MIRILINKMGYIAMNKKLHLSHKLLTFIILILLLLSITSTSVLTTTTHAATRQQAQPAQNNIYHLPTNTPTPFLHRPYYGNQTILQRTVSFVDHDKPWYVNDGLFVRYDGAQWTGVSIGSCIGGVNCYDGHNGYDLNLWYEPVLSAAAGTVIRAGWYNPLDHNSSLGLWVAIDHGNGFVTAYGHLSAITVQVGDQVGTQWQIGTSGTTGSSTGPHLHMATYYLPYWQATDPFGWTGNYADPNIVPDNYLWVSNPASNGTVPLLSANGSAVYPGATLVDDGSAGWSSTGNWQVATSPTDIGGSMHWTTTTSGNATATATWQPTLPADGYYEVGAFVDDNHADSSWSPFTIYSADPNQPGVEVSHTIYLDQSHIGSFQGPYSWENTGPQWVGLGTYYFRASQLARVVLSNGTDIDGEQLGADAVEFVPVSVQATPPPPVYAFSVNSDNLPAIAAPSGTLNVNLTLKNTGNFTWNNTGSNAVQLLYRWLNTQGQTVASNTLALPQSVNAGETVTLSATLATPSSSGNYNLQWDMQQGNIIFSQHGATPFTQPITLTSAVPETYYFAEGYTGTDTDESLTLTNLSTQPATIGITYLYADAPEQVRTYQLAGQAQSVLNINQEAGANQAVAMIVQGNQPFIAQRVMLTNDGSFAAATASLGTTQLSTSWYFAEANTTTNWNTLLSILNPSSQAVTINISYLPDTQSNTSPLLRPLSVTSVPPQSRTTLVLNQLFPDQRFGMAISASAPVLIERPEYLTSGQYSGGSSVVGATTPQETWYFGAGNTQSGSSEQLLLANPNPVSATVQISYLTDNGQSVKQSVQVPAMSRSTVNVNATLSTPHATVITASQPIVAEQQEQLTLNGVTGSTTTMGSSSLYSSWYIPSGNNNGQNTQLDLANPNAQATQVQIACYTGSGLPILKSYTLATYTHLSLSVAQDLAANQYSGIMLYATQPIIVEQHTTVNIQGAGAVYSSMGAGI
jgi:murein DD-endopeptidase MepM/ murein hydrolase activator NlpD